MLHLRKKSTAINTISDLQRVFHGRDAAVDVDPFDVLVHLLLDIVPLEDAVATAGLLLETTGGKLRLMNLQRRGTETVEMENLPSVRHGVVDAKLLVLLPDQVAQVEGDL